MAAVIETAMTTAPMMVFAGEQFGAGSAGLAVGTVNAVGLTGSSLSGVVFGPLLDAIGSFGAIWWTCIPTGIVRVALLELIPDGAGVDGGAANPGSTGVRRDVS